MRTSDWPYRNFERRVPKACVPFLLKQGYVKTPEPEKKAWLESHFYLPAGWPRCRDYARIKSLTRLRQHCWDAIRPQVVKNIGERCETRGRPLSRQLREASLYRLIHTVDPIPAEWCWPLIELAVYERKLPAEERLWIIMRPSVLNPEVSRGLALAIAKFATGTSEIPGSILNKAVRLLQQRMALGSSTATTQHELRHLLRDYPDTVTLETFTSVAEADSNMALRCTLANAGRLLFMNGVSRPAVMERFHQILSDYVSHEML